MPAQIMSLPNWFHKYGQIIKYMAPKHGAKALLLNTRLMQS